MDDARPLDPAELLAQVNWVRRLARALVRDAHAAEDLAQETLRVGTGATLRAWLQRVARRLALDRWRSDTSRALRERAVAPREPTEGTFEVVARSARQQRVVAAVHELAEPYRATILYRYLDELPTREVARRMGVTEELVRKRLERGLALLRQKLDVEFGSDTKSWALALLSLPGAAVVSVKAKLVVAAVVMVAAAVTWRAVLPDGERRRIEAPQAAAAKPAAATAETATTAPAAAATRDVATDLGVKEVAPTNATGEATILHVSVVTSDKRPCTSGHLAGFWGEGIHGGGSPRSIEEEIAGPVTDLVLPVTAASVTLTASVDGYSPSRQMWITELRKEKKPKERHGRVEKSVTIEVGGHETGPRLTGQILVDGLPRVPRGLDFFIQTEPGRGDDEARFRVHALDCRYEIGPIHPRIQSLVVTSDETVPRQIDLDLDGRDATRDLELESGKTLRLTVVDRRTDQRVTGVELYLSIGYVTKTTLFNQHWRDHSHFMRTGRDGVAVVTGLPTDGRLDVRRDATRIERTMEINAGEQMKTMQPSEPLLSVELDERSPQILERTLRLDVEGRPRKVFGKLLPEFLAEGAFGEEAAEVHYATIHAGDRWYRNDDTIPHDEQGNWKLDVNPDAEYRIFVERERRRISQVASVKVESDDVGPVELLPRPGTDVVLRLVRCPAEGFISIFVEDPGAVTPLGTTRPIHGGTYERKLRLEGAARVSITWYRDSRERKSAPSKSVTVDPATMPVVEVDLESADARNVELTLSSGKLPGEARLHLLQIPTEGIAAVDTRTEVRAEVEFVGGRCRNPVAIAPGRYLYRLSMENADAIVLGVVDVTAGPSDRPIAIHCDLEPHKKSDLGAGVQISEIGGLELADVWPGIGRLRFADRPDLVPGDAVLLPVGAKFTVLEK